MKDQIIAKIKEYETIIIHRHVRQILMRLVHKLA